MKKYINMNKSMRDILKPVRVYHNGKRTKNVYLSGNRFTRTIKWIKIIFARTVRIAIVGAIIWGGFAAYNYVHEPVINTAHADMPQDTLKVKVEAMKQEIIETIYNHEKGTYEENDGLITFDPLVSNPGKTKKKDVPSIGTMQWKQSTVVGYYKVLYGKDITMKEAAMIALDDEKAKALAYDVIFNNPTEKQPWLHNWRNASIKYDIGTKMTLIRELEK